MYLKSFCVLLTLVLLPLTSFAETMSVSFSGADIRTAPSAAASKVIFTANRYYPLEVLSSEKEYYRVKDHLGRSGYVHKSLLSEAKSIVVTADTVNVRQGPGTEHSVVYQLNKGDAAKLVSQADGWVEIDSGKGNGWVADFLVWGE